MKSLIPIILVALSLAIVTEMQSRYTLGYYGEKVYFQKNRLFYTVMSFAMAVFVGLRTRGNDTYAYRQMYEMIGDSARLNAIEWTNLASAPGFKAVSIVLHNSGFSTQDYLMFFAIVTVTIYLWFIYKYSCDIPLTVYFFITMGVYTFTMAAIKQTVAVAFALIATDYAIEKKWYGYVAFLVLAELFHPYAFVFLAVPFMFFSPWSKKTYVMLGVTLFLVISMERVVIGIFQMTDSLGYSYDANAFTGEGVNVFRVAVVSVVGGLSFLSKRYLSNSNDRRVNLFINLSILNALIMFIGLFGTANYFARLANYFLVFQVLSTPIVFRYFEKNSQRLLVITSVICYGAYFYYQVAVANGCFDLEYSFLTLSSYFSQVFRF